MVVFSFIVRWLFVCSLVFLFTMALNPDVMDAIWGAGGVGGAVGGGGSNGPEYLQTEKRGAMSRISLNTGTAYLTGAGIGGL